MKVTFSVDGGPSRIGMIDVDPIGSTPQLLESLMELGDTLYEPGALVASQCAVWYTTFSGESKRMYVTKTSMADKVSKVRPDNRVIQVLRAAKALKATRAIKAWPDR